MNVANYFMFVCRVTMKVTMKVKSSNKCLLFQDVCDVLCCVSVFFVFVCRGLKNGAIFFKNCV